MTRQLVILGTSVTLPDPASVTELAARFQEQGEQLADVEATVQGLARPDAWGDWTGLAADAFGQSIGQLPAELGDVCDAYEDVASALRQYAGQLEPVVNSLSSLFFQAEDAEYTLAAVERARSQAIAQGPVAVAAWDIKLVDAVAIVAELRLRLNGLLAELNALASACTRQVKAAEPRTAHKSLFGELESDFVRDVADPLARAAKEAAKLGEEAAKLELAGAEAVAEALFIHPITGVLHDATLVLHDAKHLDAEDWGRTLGDVAGVLGIVALLPIPGVDVVAGVAAMAFAGAAAAADWVAAAEHEKGASYMQAGLATVGFALAGVGLVARGAVDADSALFTKSWNDPDELEELASGRGASLSSLWKAGLNAPLPGIKDLSEGYQLAKAPLNAVDADSGLAGLGQAVSNTFRGEVGETFNGGLDDLSHSPAGVTMAHIGWTADRLNDLTGTVQDIHDQVTESKVP